MKKIKIKTLLRFAKIFDKGKSSTNPVSNDETYDVLTDLKPIVGNYTITEKNSGYSRMFFLNAMNQYEFRLNLEFNE